MKMRILGVFMMIVGFVGVAVGISFMSGAADEAEAPAVVEEANTELTIGKYYLNGDESNDCIEIFDDETFILTGNERQSYKMRIWENIAETDEATGKITVKDLYFLGTNLDGGTSYAEKIQFHGEDNSLEYNNHFYFLVK